MDDPVATIERANRAYLEADEEHAGLMRVFEEVAAINDRYRAMRDHRGRRAGHRAERRLRREGFGKKLISLGKNMEVVSRARIEVEAMRHTQRALRLIDGPDEVHHHVVARAEIHNHESGGAAANRERYLAFTGS